MTLRYGSACSGIEAASVAWHPLGWRASFLSEIEPFPRAVLQHHYPEVPLHGDFTTIEARQYEPIDLLVGGTPCQDNSIGYAAGAGVAGNGLDGGRSGLAFCFAELADRLGAEWVVWENVPNVLSRRHSNGFLRFLSDLAEFGYFCSWRVLDQRDFGPADQPRPRLFVVGNRTDPRRPAAVLLEPSSACRNSPTRPEAAPVLTARGGMAFDDRTPCVLDRHGPRVATPLEWERAMGFPDNYTLVEYRGKLATNGPRFASIGNSMSIRVMRWIGERIEMVERICADAA